MKIILLGAPGAGKGTHAEILTKTLGIPQISTGNILRAAIENKTAVGIMAKDYIENGKLVPDDIIFTLVEVHTSAPECENGYILDGVPRTLAQARALESHGINVDHVLYIDVDDQTVITRLSGRRICRRCGTPYHMTSKPPKQDGICDLCGGELITRSDDKYDIVAQRLRVYHEVTEPIIGFYEERGLLRRIPGGGTLAEVTDAITSALGA